MKFFIIEGTFKEPVPIVHEELEKVIAGHLVFLQKGFDEGWILVSGPKARSGGGIILSKALSLEVVEEFLSNDPLQASGVQDYKIIEFRLHDCQDTIKEWFR